MCATRVTAVVLCVCGVSVFSILPSRTVRCPTRGISGYSVENVVKLKGIFSKLRSSKCYKRYYINLYTATKSAIFFMYNVSVYLSVTHT